MVSSVVVYLPVGAVAALLTTCEYFLTTVTGLAARAVVRGAWLLTLHRGGAASINGRARARRALVRDSFTFLLGIWYVASVALIESNLQTTYVIDDTPMLSESCVRLDRPLRASLLESLVPPMKSVLEPWVMHIAKNLKCDGGALSSVGVGSSSNFYGVKTDMYAPVCSTNKTVDAKSLNVSYKELRAFPNMLSAKPGTTEIAEIFPYSTSLIRKWTGSHFGPLFANDQLDRMQGGICELVNISSLHTAMSCGWISMFTESTRISTTIHRWLCSLHSSKKPSILSIAEAAPCIYKAENLIKPDCLRIIALAGNALERAHLANVSALIVGKERDNGSYACVDATVLIEYVFISPDSLPLMMGIHKAPSNPVLVPTTFTIEAGHCERTTHVLGRAALIYSADAEWRQTDMADLDRATRYHAYMIAVSSSQFPLNTCDRQKSDNVGDCYVRRVAAATEIPKDWRFMLLISAVIFSLTLMTFGIVFRMMFHGKPWTVGSTEWSLSQFMHEQGKTDEGTHEPEIDVEVIVKPISSNTDEPFPGYGAGQQGDPSRVVSTGLRTSLNHIASTLRDRRHFEYHIRRVCPSEHDN